MATKEVSILVDFEKIESRAAQRREEEGFTKAEEGMRSTIVSLGKDPRIVTKKQLTSPDLRLVEILKDGLDNPYTELNWRSTRYDIDTGGVVGFNIYRKTLRREDILESRRDPQEKLLFYNMSALDKLGRKIGRTGKFSSHKKAIFQVRRGAIPLSYLNPNLDIAQKTAQANFENTLGQNRSNFSRLNPIFSEQSSPQVSGEFERFFSRKRFEKIGYVDYSQALKKDRQKFVFVKEREFIDLSFQDKTVEYSKIYEYYIVPVTKDLQRSLRSNVIRLEVMDQTPIRHLARLTVAQVNETAIRLRICMDSRDEIRKAIIYRKIENEFTFKRAAVVDNVNDCINLLDSSVKYNKQHIYRVFLENIHGTLSEPEEITIVSSAQKITPYSRSNFLKVPILSAVQDQNSDFIKITMSANDPNISYYELQRRDLSIHERRFSVPSKLETNYGGDGWETNKFFVKRRREVFENRINRNRDLFGKRSRQNEIVFIDDTVAPGHIYQYRVKGCDLFCNPSPYALKIVKAVTKKILRTPINLRSETLRGSPFRIKLSWGDDNAASKFTEKELFEGITTPSVVTSQQLSDASPTITSPITTPIQAGDTSPTAPSVNVVGSIKQLYKIQRRKLGEIRYETFPVTSNKFLVDEVTALDAVDFSGERTNDVIQRQPDISLRDDAISVATSVISRPFTFPPFLEENDIYFYRIATIDQHGNESNFTEDFEVSSLPTLSDPLNIKVEVLNLRVRPLVARISWDTDNTKAAPDRFVIERKFDILSDSFDVIGEAYIKNQFLDKDLEIGNTYIYRIKSMDALGRESQFFEMRLTV